MGSAACRYPPARAVRCRQADQNAPSGHRNYQKTFDRLRRVMGGIDAWILVLDTRDQRLVRRREGYVAPGNSFAGSGLPVWIGSSGTSLILPHWSARGTGT